MEPIFRPAGDSDIGAILSFMPRLYAQDGLGFVDHDRDLMMTHIKS